MTVEPKALNPRFSGAWILESYELQASDGTVTLPLGERPRGMFSWDPAGYVAVQLGPANESGEGYTAFYGTWQAPDGDAGQMLLRVTASSAPARIAGELVRNFTFLEPGLLRMRPPLNADGSQATILWRRAAGG